MSNTKIVIICLILVVAIFFIGLSLNLIDKPGQNLSSHSDKAKQNQTASSLSKESWVGAVNKLLSPLAPKFDKNDFSVECPNMGKSFKLTPNRAECAINILGFDDKAFKKLSLTPSTRTAQLFVTFKPDGEPGNYISWPSTDHNGDQLEFVVMSDKKLKDKIAARVSINCKNCDKNQLTVTISYD